MFSIFEELWVEGWLLIPHPGKPSVQNCHKTVDKFLLPSLPASLNTFFVHAYMSNTRAYMDSFPRVASPKLLILIKVCNLRSLFGIRLAEAA